MFVVVLVTRNFHNYNYDMTYFWVCVTKDLTITRYTFYNTMWSPNFLCSSQPPFRNSIKILMKACRTTPSHPLFELSTNLIIDLKLLVKLFLFLIWVPIHIGDTLFTHYLHFLVDLKQLVKLLFLLIGVSIYLGGILFASNLR